MSLLQARHKLSSAFTFISAHHQAFRDWHASKRSEPPVLTSTDVRDITHRLGEVVGELQAAGLQLSAKVVADSMLRWTALKPSTMRRTEEQLRKVLRVLDSRLSHSEPALVSNPNQAWHEQQLKVYEHGLITPEDEDDERTNSYWHGAIFAEKEALQNPNRDGKRFYFEFDTLQDKYVIYDSLKHTGSRFNASYDDIKKMTADLNRAHEEDKHRGKKSIANPKYSLTSVTHEFPLTDIGQIEPENKKALASLVKQGIVITYEDYTFPKIKRGYAVATGKKNQ